MSCVDMMRFVISDKTKDVFPAFVDDEKLTELLMLCASRLDECVSNNEGACIDVGVDENMMITVELQMLSYDPELEDDPLIDVLHAAVYVDFDVTDDGDNIFITLTLPGVWKQSAE